MNGRPAGGAMFRKRTHKEEAELLEHQRRISLERSKEPHAFCPEKPTRRDGSPILFRMKEGCPFHEFECEAIWEPVVCPIPDLCTHSA